MIADFKNDPAAEFEIESDEFAKEMAAISDNDIVIDKEDLNFIDNISWDTASLEDCFGEESGDGDDRSQNSCDSDGNMIKIEKVKPKKKK